MELRPARRGDHNILYGWRKADENEAIWYGGRSLSAKEFQRLTTRRVESPLVEMWIAWHEKAPVGQVRVDSNGEISYSVASEWRGNGFGADMVQRAVRLSQHDRMKASVLHANEAGIRTLLSAGFEYRPDVDFFLLRP